MGGISDEEKVARASAILDGVADIWFAQSGYLALELPDRFIRIIKGSYAEGLYEGHRIATDKSGRAVPSEDWVAKKDDPVLLYVVHDNARFECDPGTRRRDWEEWCVGYWTDFNGGGWVWNGLCGVVKFVAPLPMVPTL